MEVRSDGAKIIVELSDADIAGEHVIRATSGQLCQLVYDGARYLVLDLKNAAYVGSSSVLAMFITLHKLLETAEGVFVLRNPSPQTNELFRITRLSEILDIDTGAKPPA